MKIVLYKDLARDIDLFLPITRFFGYNYNSDDMRYVYLLKVFRLPQSEASD